MALGCPVRENGPQPGLLDLTGDQVQVDQAEVLIYAYSALVQSMVHMVMKLRDLPNIAAAS